MVDPPTINFSAGRKSLNESGMELGSITGGDNLFFNQTLTTEKVKIGKAKPRDFKFNASILKSIGADNYDRMPDLSELKVNLED